MSEIVNQVSDRMLITRATVFLKNGDSLGSPGDMLGLINHALPQFHNRS
jgi:hypothetical protein